MFSITSFGKDGIKKIKANHPPPDMLSAYSQEKQSPSKVYFKTLETGQSFLNNKKKIKERIEGEIASIECNTAAEFKVIRAQLEAERGQSQKQDRGIVSPYLED